MKVAIVHFLSSAAQGDVGSGPCNLPQVYVVGVLRVKVSGFSVWEFKL